MRTYWNAFIILYFLVQAILPIRGFVVDGYNAWGRFSWNMYSQVNLVRARYAWVTADGEEIAFNYKQHFKRVQRATMVHHRDTLPLFHEYLCNEMEKEPAHVKLYGSVVRKVNDGPEEQFVEWGVDVCTAPNFGVLPR